MAEQNRDRHEPDPHTRAREPQSYGSERDWVTGRTDQTVSETQPAGPMPDVPFYESRHDSEQSEGGSVGAFQLQDGTDPMPPNARAEDVEPSTSWKVTESASGRHSYWRERDYE